MTRMITPALLLMFASLLFQPPLPTAGKVVFLRGNALITANGDGTNVRELTTDDDKKGHPQWSPDGTKIMYEAAGNQTTNPKSHARLRVVDADGKQLAEVPVFSTMPDGSTIYGMRFVESSGWQSASTLFAEGSASPSVGEYVVFDLSGRARASYLGSDFATCALRGETAQRGDLRDTNSRKTWIEINRSTVYSVASVGTDIRDVLWSAGCTRLMFQETRGDAAGTVVVLRGRTVEARLPLPADFGYVTPYASGHTFLITSPSKALLYDVPTRTFKPGDTALAAMKARTAIVERLGGRDPNWWPPVSGGR